MLSTDILQYFRYMYSYSTKFSEHDLNINRPMFMFVRRTKFDCSSNNVRKWLGLVWDLECLKGQEGFVRKSKSTWQALCWEVFWLRLITVVVVLIQIGYLLHLLKWSRDSYENATQIETAMKLADPVWDIHICKHYLNPILLAPNTRRNSMLNVTTVLSFDEL